MPDLQGLGRVLVLSGALLAGVGLLFVVSGRLGFGLGQLPGDLVWEGRAFTFYLPLATSLILSLILTFLLNLFLRR